MREEARQLARGKPFGALGSDRLVTHNLIVVGGTVAAGSLGFAFAAVISHRLTPGDFGSVFAVNTLLTLIWLPATAFGVVMARQTSRDRARGDATLSTALLQGANRSLLLVGLIFGLGLLVASPWLRGLLLLPPPVVAAAAIGVPFGLALPLLLGELQGEQSFFSYSALITGQAGLKLVAAIALGTFFGAAGVVLGISVAAAISYFVAFAFLHRKLLAKAGSFQWMEPALRFLALVLPSTVAVAVLLSADTLIVKHYFSEQVTGQYAAVVALGRAIYFGAAGVAGVLFPKMVFRQSQGRSDYPLVLFSIALVLLGGVFGVVMLGTVSTALLTAFSGAGYAAAAPYLPWYSVGMTLFGASGVLIAAHQSRGRPAFLGVLIPISLLEPFLIARFHQSILQVVQVLDVCMAALLVGLILPFVARRRSEQPTGGKALAPTPS